MRHLILMLVIFTAAATCRAQSPAAAEDPLAESRRIGQELAALETTPVAKQMQQFNKQMADMRQEHQKQLEVLQVQSRELQNTDEWKAYQEKRDRLIALRSSAWEQERQQMSEAAKALYGARHEQLRHLAAGDLPEARKLGLDVLSYPRVDGSTSTHPLAVIMAARILGTPYEWFFFEPQLEGFMRTLAPLPPQLFVPSPLGHGGYFPSGRGGVPDGLDIPASRVLAKPVHPQQQRLAQMINSVLALNSNTNQSFLNLIAGGSDLILTARAPSADEMEQAADKGVKTELAPIARDALVFIVHYQNSVKGLTSEQIRDIYRGKITEWKEVGAEPPKSPQHHAIWPLRRQRNSGSRELFDELVMRGEALSEDSEITSLFETRSMSGPYNRVTRQPNALGYSVYYYEHFMAASPYTRALAVDSVEPNADTIASGAYPLTAPVYAVYRADEPADSPARKLLAWLLSEEGRAVIRESGYVPVQ